MAMLNSEKDKIIKLCDRMVGNVPFSVYEEGTFDIKSKVYCFKSDENGFCTVSDEPIKNRLVAAALIFKNVTHSQVAINFNNDLDEVTHDVFAIVKEMLENFSIKCIDFDSIENDAEHPCYTLQYLTETGIDEITGEEDITQLIANIDEYFDVSADFDDIVGAISIRYGFNDATLDNCAAFFIPSARLSDDNLEEIQEFIRYSGLTSSYLGPNIFVSNGVYLPDHKPGLFFLLSWGCPPSYYDNHIGVDSIDLFGLVSCLLYIKKYCDNKSKGEHIDGTDILL